MNRKEWREQVLTKKSDEYVVNCRGKTEVERRDTAVQIRRILALSVPDESEEMLAQAGVTEGACDMRSAIIVRQAVRALDREMRAGTWLLKHSGDDPRYQLELEKLRILRESIAAEKNFGGCGPDGGHHLPSREGAKQGG